jgi:hypothetical protein
MSKPPEAHTAAATQQQQQQQPYGRAVHFEQCDSFVFAAGVPASVTSAHERLSPTHASMQQQGSLDAWLAAAGSSGGTAPGSPLGSAGGVASGSTGLGSAGSAVLQQLQQQQQQQLQQQQQQQVGPLDDHPNLATAGGPGSAPLGVLQITLQVRRRSIDISCQDR